MLSQSHTPSATHRYTANTHTQLPVLDNYKYPSSQIFGQSQISQILCNWYHTHHQAILDNHKYLTKTFFSQQQYQS